MLHQRIDAGAPAFQSLSAHSKSRDPQDLSEGALVSLIPKFDKIKVGPPIPLDRFQILALQLFGYLNPGLEKIENDPL